MYFEREAVHRLIAACAARFPGNWMVFDAVPKWLAQRDPPQSANYTPPRWEWGLDADEERALAALPGVAELRALRLPRGRGVVYGFGLPLVSRVALIRRGLLTVYAARFGRMSDSSR